MRILRSPSLNLRRWHGADFGVLLLWFVGALLLEMTGRFVDTDVGDGASLLVVALMVGVTLWAHRRQRLTWLKPIGAAMRRACYRLISLEQRLGNQFGIDYRHRPRVPAALPGFLVVGCGALLVTSCLTVAGAALLPGAFRRVAVEVSYCGYLTALATLWAALLLGCGAILLVAWFLYHDHAIRRERRGQRPWTARRWLALGVAVASLVLVRVLPSWAPLAVVSVAVTISAALLALPGPTHIALLWRNRERRMFSVDFGQLFSVKLALGFLAVITLSMLSFGDQLIGAVSRTDSTMAVTAMLGRCFAWLAAAGSTCLAFHTVRYSWHRLRFERARRRPLGLRIVASGGPAESLDKALAARGLRLVIGRGFGLPIRIVEHPEPTDPFAPRRWPLVVTDAELRAGRHDDAIRRRYDQLLRRQLLHGLSRIFRDIHSQSKRHRKGEGFWLSPQFWFAIGVTRDENREEMDLSKDCFIEEPLQPRFDETLSWPARACFADVMRAADLDLIFVEDGVDFPRLRAVLESVFEFHDIFGGREPASDRHFVGLHGVKVVIHDFQFDHPYRSTRYPEPEYDAIARARVLHVFLDRGDAVDPWEAPIELRDVPLPRVF